MTGEEYGDIRIVKGIIGTQIWYVNDTGAIVPATDPMGTANDGGDAEVTTDGTGGAVAIISSKTGYSFHVTDVDADNRSTTTTYHVRVSDGDPASTHTDVFRGSVGQEESIHLTSGRRRPCTGDVYVWALGAGAAITNGIEFTVSGYWTKNA